VKVLYKVAEGGLRCFNLADNLAFVLRKK